MLPSAERTSGRPYVSGVRKRRISPLIYLSRLDTYTTTVGLAFFQGQFVGKWPEMMAGALVSILPMVLLFVIAQQYFVRGIAISGLKG